MRVWLRAHKRCAGCGVWRGITAEEPWGGHDPCIERLPGVDYACCGHGVRQGYVSCGAAVLRFPGDVHPFLIRAAVNRLRRSGAVPGWARKDADDFWDGQLSGCRFSTGLDRRYRRRKFRSRKGG